MDIFEATLRKNAGSNLTHYFQNIFVVEIFGSVITKNFITDEKVSFLTKFSIPKTSQIFSLWRPSIFILKFLIEIVMKINFPDFQ